jgi:hypothetical protein
MQSSQNHFIVISKRNLDLTFVGVNPVLTNELSGKTILNSADLGTIASDIPVVSVLFKEA